MIEQSHSLWLLPESGLLALLSRAVREFSQILGGPVFTPHVTLLSRITGSQSALCELTERLALEICPFELTVTASTHSKHCYRAIVLELAKCPPLEDARRRAQHAFKSRANEPFTPHLSLAYGEFTARQALDALRAILPSIPARFEAGAIELVRASTEIPVESWRSLCRVPLRAAQPPGEGPIRSA